MVAPCTSPAGVAHRGQAAGARGLARLARAHLHAADPRGRHRHARHQPHRRHTQRRLRRSVSHNITVLRYISAVNGEETKRRAYSSFLLDIPIFFSNSYGFHKHHFGLSGTMMNETEQYDKLFI